MVSHAGYSLLAWDAAQQAIGRLTCHAHEACRLLMGALTVDRPVAREGLAAQLLDVEQAANDSHLAALDALQRALQHPRAPVLHMMAVDLGDLVDQTYACAVRTTTTDLAALPHGTQELALALARAVDHLGLSWAAHQAGLLARSRWHAQAVSKLTVDSRQLLIALVADLLETNPPPGKLESHRDLLEGLARAAELCDDAAAPMRPRG